jgi:hypothetical protein
LGVRINGNQPYVKFGRIKCITSNYGNSSMTKHHHPSVEKLHIPRGAKFANTHTEVKFEIAHTDGKKLPIPREVNLDY